MSCIITYKGKKYSEEQFKEYFNNNKQEFVSSIAKNKNVIDSFKRKMKGVDYVFSQSPELASIGTKAQYLQYLSTIFKTSKVKDIVYRGVPYKNANFDKKHLKPALNAFYFTDSVNEAKYYGSTKRDEDNNVLEYGTLFPAVLNIKNPYNNQLGLIKNLEDIKEYEIYYPDLRISAKTVKLLQDNNYDGYVTQVEFGEQHNFGQTQDYKYKVVFEPEQIHILSSKKDIEGFKEFVNNKSSQVENIEVDGVPNINNEEKSLKLALKGLTPEEKISFCNHFGITMTEENGKKC